MLDVYLVSDKLLNYQLIIKIFLAISNNSSDNLYQYDILYILWYFTPFNLYCFHHSWLIRNKFCQSIIMYYFSILSWKLLTNSLLSVQYTPNLTYLRHVFYTSHTHTRKVLFFISLFNMVRHDNDMHWTCDGVNLNNFVILVSKTSILLLKQGTCF